MEETTLYSYAQCFKWCCILKRSGWRGCGHMQIGGLFLEEVVGLIGAILHVARVHANRVQNWASSYVVGSICSKAPTRAVEGLSFPADQDSSCCGS